MVMGWRSRSRTSKVPFDSDWLKIWRHARIHSKLPFSFNRFLPPYPLNPPDCSYINPAFLSIPLSAVQPSAPRWDPFSSFLALPPSLLPREGVGQNALTGWANFQKKSIYSTNLRKGHPVLMVQGPKGHQGASEVHLPAGSILPLVRS